MEEVKKMLPRKEYIKIRGANEHNLKNMFTNPMFCVILNVPNKFHKLT